MLTAVSLLNNKPRTSINVWLLSAVEKGAFILRSHDCTVAPIGTLLWSVLKEELHSIRLRSSSMRAEPDTLEPLGDEPVVHF